MGNPVRRCIQARLSVPCNLFLQSEGQVVSLLTSRYLYIKNKTNAIILQYMCGVLSLEDNYLSATVIIYNRFLLHHVTSFVYDT